MRLAAWSVLLQPRRLAAALTCTTAVVASAAVVRALAPPGTAPLLPPVFGGLVAFNTLLFFPPGTLAGHPRRLVAALLANLVSLPVAPLLYRLSPALADAALVLAAGASVLARPSGAPLSGLALLLAIGLLVPLVMGAMPALVPLGAIAAAVGTIFAAIGDTVAVRLLRARAPDFERWLLRQELAGFLGDLARNWRSGEIWPDPRLAARIGRVRLIREDVAPTASAGLAPLPPEAMLEGVERCAGRLRAERGALSLVIADTITCALDALAAAARDGAPDRMRRALDAIREAAQRPPGPGETAAFTHLLGLALLLSDLAAAGLGEAAA